MNRDPREIQLACFRLGESLFGVDIMRIREIILPRKISLLPDSSPCLEGVITLRGDLIPVMNLARRLSIASSAAGDGGRFLILRYAEMVLALMVDEVIQVMTVPVDQIKPPPDLDGFAYESVLGVCLSGESVVMILDIDALPDPDQHRTMSRGEEAV